ncbi:MAG: dockerin type I repeat-containing protein, partial [Clostridia bacterium]|nr:dockerin type I repeat-containing protein [Clostridia bacterium]
MPESVLESADQLFYAITDAWTFDWFSYEAGHFAKKTHISIEVPKGGYFTITNNIANSPGTLLYNTADFMSTVLSGSITLVNMNNAVDEVVKDIISDDAVYDAFMSALMNIGVNVANQSLTVGVGTASNALVTDVEGVFESLGLGFNSFCSTAAGIAQDVFTSFDTPFGKALELCFKISELSNTTCQMLNLLNSDDNVYLAIHTNESAQNRVMNGVIVDDSGNAIDREAMLQVFRVTDISMSDIEISTDSELKFDDYVTYNICFVKNETEVQPNGKVQVKIPIPEGMDKKSCCVLREEKNGKWTVLTARVEGNYLVFETDHFSKYVVADMSAAVIGDTNSDGEIDVKDAVLLAQYLAGWSVTVDMDAADCNADGEVDVKDAVLLAQYL